MGVNLSKQTADLRTLLEQLKQRCLEAESRVSDLQQQLAEQHTRYEQLEAEKSALEMKYQSLQTGLTAIGNDPQQIDQLKAQYLAMVSELDACIAMLQHG